MKPVVWLARMSSATLVASIASIVSIASIAAIPAPARAQSANGLYFQHRDWEIACDNTGTCRAAGYHAEADDRRVSVLLTRAAGPGRPVAGVMMLGEDDDRRTLPARSPRIALEMRIDGRGVGTVSVGRDELRGALSADQVRALTAALRRDTRIEWVLGARRWRLSDAGASAVLLKMDAFQGRLDTPGALVRTGARAEQSVPPPRPAPLVRAVAIPPTPPEDARRFLAAAAPWQAALATTVEADGCPLLKHDDRAHWSAVRLDRTKWLVSAPCWQAAYNTGDGYWVIDAAAPAARPVLVTTSGVDFSDGVVSSGQKGRGVGDCWSLDDWTWDGSRFVHTSSATTGLCRLMSAGGAWELPTRVSDVRPAK